MTFRATFGRWARIGSGAALAALGLTDAAAAQGTEVQELIVTGSRLPKADFTADSPIVTVEAEGLQASAALTLEAALNRLPQVVPSFSSGSNNPSVNGAAFVDLRGLGPNRNLVLLDGRRIVGGNASNSVDLNVIPPALIDRVEVITGGASAVYGADAVAGVVNVILRREFEGLEGRARTLVSDRGDGRQHELSLTAGRALGDLSITASLGWSRREEMSKGERAFSSQAAGPSSFLPSGSYSGGANLPSQAAVNSVFARYGVGPGQVTPRGGVGGFSFNADGTLFSTGLPDSPIDVQNYRGGDADIVRGLFPDVYAYNFEPFNKLILPLERWSGALFVHGRPTEGVELFGHLIGARYTAATALAPTPAPTDPNPLYPGLGVIGFTIPVTNPFIPPDLAELLASRQGDAPALAGVGPNEEFLYRFRSVALGARQSDTLAKTANGLIGARFELPHGWRAEATLSHGRYERREIQDGLLDVRRFEQLLDSPTGGRDLCEGGFNPFGGVLGDTCREFLRVRARYRTTVKQTNALATVTGPLFDAPAGPVLAVAGAEYRRVGYSFRPPVGITPGEVAGFIPLTAVEGSIRFSEVFGEVAVPLLRDAPGAHSLDVTLGYRRSEERDSGGVDAWKAEVGWAPIRTLKIRGAVQRAVRAPDIFERFEPPVSSFLPAIDPCADDSGLRSEPILALCRAQAAALGFPVDFGSEYNQFFPEVSVQVGGAPDVRPERATTYTLGAVWRPDWRSPWVNGFAATVDAYAIKVRGAIGYEDPQLALNACYNIGGGNPTYDPANPFCRRLTRSAVDFSLFDVPARETNQEALETRGVDASLRFRTELAEITGRPWLGRLGAQVSVSWLERFVQQASPVQPRIDYVGTVAAIDGYTTLPRWKALGTVTWTSEPVELSLTGRFIDSMENRALRRGLDPSATGVDDVWYWDLFGRWTLGRAELTGGVLNLFDRGPELYRPAIDSNTEPSTYDVIGRRFWIGVRVRL